MTSTPTLNLVLCSLNNLCLQKISSQARTPCTPHRPAAALAYELHNFKASSSQPNPFESTFQEAIPLRSDRSRVQFVSKLLQPKPTAQTQAPYGG